MWNKAQSDHLSLYRASSIVSAWSCCDRNPGKLSKRGPPKCKLSELCWQWFVISSRHLEGAGSVHSHRGAHSPSGLQGTGMSSGLTGANPNHGGLELEANEHCWTQADSIQSQIQSQADSIQ